MSWIIWTLLSVILLFKINQLKTSKFHITHLRSIFILAYIWSISLCIIQQSGDVHPNPGPNTTSSLDCILLNAQSLKAFDKTNNKIQDLQNIVYTTWPYIISICETWLLPEFADADILSPSYYKIIRKDRTTKGGGVLTAVRNSIYSIERPDLETTNKDDNEIVVTEVRPNPTKKLYVLSCYKSQADNEASFLSNFETTLANCISTGCLDLLILGDFNFPGLKWGTAQDTKTTENSTRFQNILRTYGLTQYNTNPSTKAGNILELILSNINEPITEIIAGYHPFRSDHFLLNFNLDLKIKQLPALTRTVYNFKRANYEAIHRELTNINLFQSEQWDSNQHIVDNLWSAFYSNLLHIINTYIPKIKIRNTNAPQWIDIDVIKASRRKHSAYTAAKKYNTQDKWTKFARLRNKVKRLMEFKYKQYINDLAKDLSSNPKQFWGFLKSKSKSKPLPNMLKDKGKEYSDPVIKANLFNRFFHSVFNKGDNIKVPIINITADPNLATIQLDEDDVRKNLMTLDPSKAIGPDGLPTKLLKLFADQLAAPLCYLFNKSLSMGHVPAQWKLANIIPIYKKGDHHCANNYRPISLLPVVSKVMERCVYDIIILHLRPKITPVQYGFLANRSIDSQLLSTFSDIIYNYDNKLQTDIVYFDIAKAFDSVPHKLLLSKLQTFGINGQLLKWFASYLSDRFQRVSIEGVYSDWLSVESGVPQGSILGPLQFILYNNDLPDVLTTGTSMSIFADDTKIFRCIRTIRDCITLQYDIDKIAAWGKKWGLKFNESKCQVISVISSIPKFVYQYKLSGINLSRVDEVIDLGINISHNLKWNVHVNTIIKKAFSRLWLILRTVGFDSPAKIKQTLYLTLVRSILEFGSTVWSPTSKELLSLLESVQRKATHIIVNNKPRWIEGYKNYKERLLECNLLPTSYRREITDIITFLRSFNSNTGYDCFKYVKFQVAGEGVTTRNQARGLTLIVKQTKLLVSAQFYPVRLTNLWNSLPYHLRERLIPLDDKEKIKRVLLPYYYKRLQDYFDPDNRCTWVHNCRCSRCSMT
jgi:hypothetical protein